MLLPKIVSLAIVLLLIAQTNGDKKSGKKYSKEANTPHLTTESYDPDFRNLQRPFRMSKLNLVWAKAQHVRENSCHCYKYVSMDSCFRDSPNPNSSHCTWNWRSKTKKKSHGSSWTRSTKTKRGSKKPNWGRSWLESWAAMICWIISRTHRIPLRPNRTRYNYHCHCVKL